MGWVVNDTPQPLYPRERPGNHRIGDCVGSKARLDASENLVPNGIRTSNRSARSESLYRLRYPGSYLHIQINNIVANLDPRDKKILRNPDLTHTFIDCSLPLFFFPKHNKQKQNKQNTWLSKWMDQAS